MAPSVSLRLVADNGENVMLTLRPEEILTLDALLALLRQLNPAGSNVCALEYEDDEGDLVTVTNDEEVGARRGRRALLLVFAITLLLPHSLCHRIRLANVGVLYLYRL